MRFEEGLETKDMKFNLNATKHVMDVSTGYLTFKAPETKQSCASQRGVIVRP